MTDKEPRERERATCPLCGATLGSPLRPCVADHRGYGVCGEQGRWTTMPVGSSATGATYVDGVQETIDDGRRILDRLPESEWTEAHWVLHEAVTTLSRIREEVADQVLDAWAMTPDTEADGRYSTTQFGQAMGLSSAAALVGLPSRYWASPDRSPLVALRRIKIVAEGIAWERKDGDDE